LFCGGKNENGKDVYFVIPDLQRSFVWESKEVKGFWEDMRDHLNGHSQIKEMFGGTVVLHEKNESRHGGETIPAHADLWGMGVKKLKKLGSKIRALNREKSKPDIIKAIDCARKQVSEIIDGQQRITILLIGAKVLSELGQGYTGAKEKKIKGFLDSVYLKYSTARIEHQGSDEKDDFENIVKNHEKCLILQTGWSNGNKGTKIKSAYEETLTYFSKILGTAKKTWSEYSDYFLHNITFVCLTTKDFYQSHLVFKSLNWKGRSLRVSEIFKSILFHYAVLNEPPRNRDKVKQEWSKIEDLGKTIHRDDVVSEFLLAWCRSMGYRRGDATENKDDQQKEVRLSETLKILEEKLKDLCSKKGNNYPNKNNVLKFVKELSADAKRFEQISNPTKSGLNALTNNWIDVVDIQRIFRQGGLNPILLRILKLDTKPKRDACINALLMATIFIVMPDHYKFTGNSEYKKATFAKDARLWVKPILNDTTAVTTLKKLASELLESKQNGKIRFYDGKTKKKSLGKWRKACYKKWKKVMKITSISPEEVKLLLRLIETIDTKSGSVDYKINYDKDLLEAEHIFPKSTKWGPDKKSDWRKDWDKDNSLWPKEGEKRTELKTQLGNYILLESKVNQVASNLTLKGHPVPKKNTQKPKPATAKNHFKGFGKIHIYQHLIWEDDELTSSKLTGSQLVSVVNFVKSVNGEDYWNKKLVVARTKRLLDKATKTNTAGKKTCCQDIDLKFIK